MNNAVVGLSLYTHNPERTACAEEGTAKEPTSGSPAQKACEMAETGAVQMANRCLDSLANERTEGVLMMIDLKMNPCPKCVKKDGEWFCLLAQKPYYAVQKCPKYALWKMVMGGTDNGNEADN